MPICGGDTGQGNKQRNYQEEVAKALGDMVGKEISLIKLDASIEEQVGIRGLEFLTLFNKLGVNYMGIVSGGNITKLQQEIIRMAENHDYCSQDDVGRYTHLMALGTVKDVEKFLGLLTPKDVADMTRHYYETKTEGRA